MLPFFICVCVNCQSCVLLCVLLVALMELSYEGIQSAVLDNGIYLYGFVCVGDSEHCI